MSRLRWLLMPLSRTTNERGQALFFAPRRLRGIRAETDRTAEATPPGVIDDYVARRVAQRRGETPRLLARVRRDFPGREDEVVALLRTAESESQDRERVLAAILVMAHGDFRALEQAVALSHVDWRDVLMNGGLGDEGWGRRLDEELGS